MENRTFVPFSPVFRGGLGVGFVGLDVDLGDVLRLSPDR
jgi:hypothetical protein